MGIYEFDQELYDQVLLENGEEIGMEKGIKIGIERGIEKGIKQASLVCKKVQTGETDNKIIAESVGCTPEEVELIRKQFGI